MYLFFSKYFQRTIRIEMSFDELTPERIKSLSFNFGSRRIRLVVIKKLILHLYLTEQIALWIAILYI